MSFLIELFYNLLGSVKIIFKVNESYPLFPTNPLGGHTTPRFAAFIQYVTHDDGMYNRHSCRGCGGYLTPASSCIICREFVSWNCDKCDSMEYVFHSINYCRPGYF